jgi:hypothetical protein
MYLTKVLRPSAYASFVVSEMGTSLLIYIACMRVVPVGAAARQGCCARNHVVRADGSDAEVWRCR